MKTQTQGSWKRVSSKVRLYQDHMAQEFRKGFIERFTSKNGIIMYLARIKNYGLYLGSNYSIARKAITRAEGRE